MMWVYVLVRMPIWTHAVYTIVTRGYGPLYNVYIPVLLYVSISRVQ